MFARYTALTTVILVVALATGYVVHKTAGHTDYRAACQFQIAPPPTSIVPSTDVLLFTGRQALDAIHRVQAGSAVLPVSKAVGISPGKVAAAQTVEPVSDSSFNVNVTYATPAGAVKLANALCNQYVQALGNQIAADQTNETTALRGRLRYLLAQLQALGTSAATIPRALYFQERQAITDAINRARGFLTVAYSQPQNEVSIASTAVTATAHSTQPPLSKSLIIAAAAALLVSFLLILVVESFRYRREGAVPSRV